MNNLFKSTPWGRIHPMQSSLVTVLCKFEQGVLGPLRLLKKKRSLVFNLSHLILNK